MRAKRPQNEKSSDICLFFVQKYVQVLMCHWNLEHLVWCSQYTLSPCNMTKHTIEHCGDMHSISLRLAQNLHFTVEINHMEWCWRDALLLSSQGFSSFLSLVVDVSSVVSCVKHCTRSSSCEASVLDTSSSTCLLYDTAYVNVSEASSGNDLRYVENVCSPTALVSCCNFHFQQANWSIKILLMPRLVHPILMSSNVIRPRPTKNCHNGVPSQVKKRNGFGGAAGRCRG